MFCAEPFVQLRCTYCANVHKLPKSFAEDTTPLTTNCAPVASSLPGTTKPTRFCYYRFSGGISGLIARNSFYRRELPLPIAA
jgi:hypothetical protein